MRRCRLRAGLDRAAQLVAAVAGACPGRRVHVVEFASTLGYKLAASTGKSREAVRSIELDDGLVRILRAQRKTQAAERLAAPAYIDSDYVFTD